MQEIKTKSIDLVLCDLPYEVTSNTWDIAINLELLWECYKRIIKDNGAIVLTAIQPFTTILIYSNIKWFKYCWVWNKNNSAGFMLAKIRPFIITEDICVFGKDKINYFPVMRKGKKRLKGGYSSSENYGIEPSRSNKESNLYYPKNLLNVGIASQVNNYHPTEKPVKLFSYLVKTYTKQGDLVLDNCVGSGTTCISSIQNKRNFIGIEKEKKYYDITNWRIKNYLQVLKEKDYEVDLEKGFRRRRERVF